MTIKRWIFCIGIIAGAMHIDAQQVPLYSQYMFNGFLINPAIAGAEGYTGINLTARQQWVGFKDSPSTYALSAHTRILRKSYISKEASVRRRKMASSQSGRVGVGGYIFSDRNGAVERTGFKGTYAYHLHLNTYQLSMGLSLTAYQFRLNPNKIILEDPSDELWLNANGTSLIPDADVGLYFDTRNFYLGLSAEQILESVLKLGRNGYDQYRMERNYYLIGGYDFRLYETVLLSPTTLVKFSEAGAFQADLSAKINYDQKYWVGATYRTTNTIILFGGLSWDKFLVGYSFDIAMSRLMRRSFGTHEFLIAVKLGDSARRYRWLNRY